LHEIPPNPKAWAIREHYEIEQSGPFYSACAAGRDAGCTFCSAILCDPVGEGDRVVVLSDYKAGRVGTVVPWPEAAHRPGLFDVLVAMDGDMADTTTWVDQSRCLVHREPSPSLPEWWPPFDLSDSSKLHEFVLRLCAAPSAGELHWLAMKAFVTKVWRLRLPIDSDEAAAMFIHHGMAEELARPVAEFCRRGHGLIVFAVGRRPILSKRSDYVRRRSRSAATRRPSP
jgi:hypothetical protein